MDTLFHVLLDMTHDNTSKQCFLTGGVGLCNLALDHERKMVGVGFLNQPTIPAESGLRTGHGSQGFKFSSW